MLQSEREKLETGAGKGQELDLGSEIWEAIPEEAGWSPEAQMGVGQEAGVPQPLLC